ncbi:MAG: response regulator, partial [bacterium]
MGKKILLADDSVTIQKIVELTFEGEGLELEVAADGHEALELAEASPPDLILADSTMPGLSGVELCRKIREHPVLKPIPVILLTNSFDDFNRADGDAAGVTAYVEKPFESQALLDQIHELLSEEGAHAPAPEEP